MKDRKHTDPYEQCVACQLERGVVEELGSKPDHWNLDADMQERLDAAFAGLDRSATPEKLSGERLAEPSFDYAKAMRDGHEAMKRQVASPPPQFSVGDTVRWWPDGHDDGQALMDRYIDGTVTTMHPLSIKVTGSHGFLDRVMGGYRMPAHGGVVDTSVSPGTVQRLNPGTPPKPPTVKTPWMRVGSPCDPLDVEYDDITLRELLCRDQIMRQSDSRGSDNAPWPSFTPVQRTAVSAHWSAELRAKVKAGAAADKARAPSVMVDHED